MVTVRCRFFGNRSWGTSSNASRSCGFHEALGCNVNVAFGAVYRVTLNRFAALTAKTFWVWGLPLPEMRGHLLRPDGAAALEVWTVNNHFSASMYPPKTCAPQTQPTAQPVFSRRDPRRDERQTKILPALTKATLSRLVEACRGKLPRRALIDLRAGRSRSHRKN
jgi:hypothetical protein